MYVVARVAAGRLGVSLRFCFSCFVVTGLGGFWRGFGGGFGGGFWGGGGGGGGVVGGFWGGLITSCVLRLVTSVRRSSCYALHMVL